MSVTIKLDSSAIAELTKDPEYKLELQRAVVAEITRRMYTTDVIGDVQNVVTRCFQQHRDDLVNAVKEDTSVREFLSKRLSDMVQSIKSGSWGTVTGKKLAPETVKLIDDHVVYLIREAAGAGTVEKRVKDAQQEIEDKVIGRIGNLSGVITRSVEAVAYRQMEAAVKAKIVEAIK